MTSNKKMHPWNMPSRQEQTAILFTFVLIIYSNSQIVVSHYRSSKLLGKNNLASWCLLMDAFKTAHWCNTSSVLLTTGGAQAVGWLLAHVSAQIDGFIFLGWAVFEQEEAVGFLPILSWQLSWYAICSRSHNLLFSPPQTIQKGRHLQASFI